MKRSKSSGRWLAEHESDEFVKKARAQGYRSRASYKLLEIDDKHSLLKPGQCVVDLGAAPGGWSQVAVDKVGDKGAVFALDILAMEPVEGVQFIQGDFTQAAVLGDLLDATADQRVDLVISDMAPNLSGMKDIDQPRAIYLVELACDLAQQVLAPGGSLLVKCFEGQGIDTVRDFFRKNFKQLSNYKPKASRNRSREIYLLGRQFKG